MVLAGFEGLFEGRFSLIVLMQAWIYCLVQAGLSFFVKPVWMVLKASLLLCGACVYKQICRLCRQDAVLLDACIYKQLCRWFELGYSFE